MNIFTIRPGHKVMAIFAHPDDAETAAGATLALYANSGCDVHLVTIARGEKGKGDHGDRDPESARAAEILGVTHVQSLGYNDGEFDNDIEMRKKLTEVIRAAQPDVVICPDPTAVFFSDAYVNHRDHRQTGWAVIDVVSSAVGNPKYFSSSQAHHVPHLLCAGTLEPNCVIDVSTSFEQKVAAVQCYKSQIGEQTADIAASLEEASRSIGVYVEGSFAEAFRYCALSPEVDPH